LEEATKEEVIELLPSKPNKAQRSLSEMGPQQAKASEGLRKHSMDVVCGTGEEAQHEKEARAISPQRATRKLEEPEGDDQMDELLRRVQKQRSVLDEILEQEDAREKEGKINADKWIILLNPNFKLIKG